jgi:hypothetical protein
MRAKVRAAMRFVWMLPLPLLAGFVACATDASDDSNDAGADGPSSIHFDASPDGTTPIDSSGGGDDNFVPFDATDPPDQGVDEVPPGIDASPCAAYVPCDPDGIPICFFNPFIMCLKADWDAGTPDATPPPKGVCIPVNFSTEQCGDGVNHCAAGERCLVASHQCLLAQEVACVCNNPATQGACGPP